MPKFRNHLTVLLLGGLLSSSFAETWSGMYTILPASATGMVLDAVGSGTTDGTAVSIGAPAGTANQQWVITPNDAESYSIRPAYSSAVALSVARGGKDNGAAIVLEADRGNPWQLWTIKKNENGTYSFLAKHAPDKGLDDFGGKKEAGTKLDLWSYKSVNQHMQWRIKPIETAGVKEEAAPIVATTTPSGLAVTLPGDVPQVQLPANAPQGVVKEFDFNNSKIFPGTVRKISVFIPAQYTGSKPACVFVQTDGYKVWEKPILEGLIADGKMPVTVGVFVRPGDIPGPTPDTFVLRNRCLEYDGLGDANVRFFLEEVLPFVTQELKLNLSTNGNDRCIAGNSSGAIAAFNAAWERPDDFRRVYATSGTFSAFRGGNIFPTLVRKTEAKPIRAYLTTGTHDMENHAGDWFLLDQEMEKALKFSGYDYKFRIIEGKHGAGNKECFAEAMTFLWKDWPEPIKAGPSAPRVQAVILPNEDWQLVASGYRDARSAACNAAGEVFFTDAPNNKLYRIDLDGNVKEFLSDAGQANGITVGPRGEIYTTSSQTGKIMSYTLSGTGSLVLDGLRGHSIMAAPKGGLYVTCNGEQPGERGTVWYVNGGKKTQVDSGLKRATGLAFRPDQWLMAVADGDSKWVYSYQISPDGTLINKERFFWLHVADWDDDAGAESVCYCKEGLMFVATRLGIQVCADAGPTQAILPMPDRSRVLGVCQGGADGDTFFAFCGDKVWKRKVKTHAIGAFSPMVKIKGTPQ